jgi:hypothetical protein
MCIAATVTGEGHFRGGRAHFASPPKATGVAVAIVSNAISINTDDVVGGARVKCASARVFPFFGQTQTETNQSVPKIETNDATRAAVHGHGSAVRKKILFATGAEARRVRNCERKRARVFLSFERQMVLSRALACAVRRGRPAGPAVRPTFAIWLGVGNRPGTATAVTSSERLRAWGAARR